MQFELARGTDEPALRRLLRAAPLAGEIRVSLEREPCIDFASAIEGERTQIIVARGAHADGVVAMGARTLLTSFVNGTPTRVGYLSLLRVLPQYQGRAGLLKRGYAALRALHGDGAATLYVTTIVADNTRARRLLEAGLAGFPTYRYLGDLLTLLLPARAPGRRPPDGLTVAGAGAADVPEIARCLARNGARFQFAPSWTVADLLSPQRSRGLEVGDFLVARRGARLVGCAALWDQRDFKQVLVRGYGTRLRLARPWWNLLAPLGGAPRLPPVGSALAFAYLSHLAVDDDAPPVFAALIEAAAAAAARRGLPHLALGLAERHPLAASARARCAARCYRSRAYLVHWSDGDAAARRIDARPMQLEVAIL